MDGVIERRQGRDRVVDRLGQVVRQRTDANVLEDVEQRAAAVLDRLGLALGHELHVDRELLRHAHDVQVDVEGLVGDPMGLDAVHEDRRRGRPVDGQVDQRVRTGVAPELLELVGVHGHVVGVDAAAEHDGGQAAVAAHLGDLLAGHLATGGGELGAGGGHAEVGPPERFDRAGRLPRPGGIRADRWTSVRLAAMGATILIVEDEHAVARGLQYALQQEGYEVTLATSGEEGLEAATREAPDLVLLDVRLPGMDGFEMLRRLRAAGTKSPVLMLTARDEEVDKVIGLELGADDYLTKPFGLRELLSRIKALLRRAYGDLADAVGGRVIRHRDLLIDLDRRRVQRGDRRISLTPTEFEILRHLASKPGRVYTRAELLDLLRDYEALDQDEKTINVHVSHLRDKLEDDPTNPAFVQTIRGVGYAFAER